MSDEAKPEALFGLPDIGSLSKLLDEAKAFFVEVKAFIEQLQKLYETHKADIDEALALFKQIVAFVRALFPSTGGGFQATG